MYSSSVLIFKYLGYYINSSNSQGHGIHSPFLFNFIKKVLNDSTDYPAYEKVEAERALLLRDKSLLTITDFGAGSGHSRKNTRKVNNIARHALKTKKYATLLFRMGAYFKPGTIIELGTSLGITTAYLALSQPLARVLTFEGADEIAARAKVLFDRLAINNISLV
ncbi:MAG: SAM-dependent methyltransferase, partial [Chitinophagaceae bacterium]